jgi:7-keto-8-aminopelargonate synthetase-like enzyme
VRLLALAFSNSYAAERTTRSATAAGSSMLFFDEDNHNLVEAACRHEEGQEVAADTVPEAEGEGSEEESDMVVQ